MQTLLNGQRSSSTFLIELVSRILVIPVSNTTLLFHKTRTISSSMFYTIIEESKWGQLFGVWDYFVNMPLRHNFELKLRSSCKHIKILESTELPKWIRFADEIVFPIFSSDYIFFFLNRNRNLSDDLQNSRL